VAAIYVGQYQEKLIWLHKHMLYAATTVLTKSSEILQTDMEKEGIWAHIGVDAFYQVVIQDLSMSAVKTLLGKYSQNK